MNPPSTSGDTQLETAAPRLRTLDAMLEAMRDMPAAEPGRASRAIPIRPTAQDDPAPGPALPPPPPAR
jgi:hypothetical protein